MRPNRSKLVGNWPMAVVLVAAAVACSSRGGIDGTAGAVDMKTRDTESASVTNDNDHSADRTSVGDDTDPSQHDPDQDGFVDDNCPSIFNPDQADQDGDGVGDDCDEVVPPASNPCGLGTSLSTEGSVVLVGNSGDTRVRTLCVVKTGGRPDVGGLRPLHETSDYVLYDVTDEDLDRLRKSGMEITVVDRFDAVSAVHLVELRIQRSPTTALDTVDTRYLANVDPEILAVIPDAALARQPVETLAAFPPGYWLNARSSAVDAVGVDRIAELEPQLVEIDPARANPDTVGQTVVIEGQRTAPRG